MMATATSQGPGARFSKVPKTFRARRAIRESLTCLFCKARLFISCKGNKNNTQLQNRSLHVVERTRTSSKCQKTKNARAKRAKILFLIVKYANLWGFCCRRRRGCLTLPSSLLFPENVKGL